MSSNCIAFGSSNTQRMEPCYLDSQRSQAEESMGLFKYTELGTSGKEHFSKNTLIVYQSPPRSLE